MANSQLLSNFLRVANTVKTGLLQKYHDGEFADPGLTDPKADAAALEANGPSWSDANV
jgi:hypothetical protein